MIKKINWRVNEQIRAGVARVIDEEGSMTGIMPVSEALSKARAAGKDLVEIAPGAKPPVVKIISFGKFKYREEKKARSLKKKTKTPDVKEIRLSPFIGDADYKTRLTRIEEFLAQGDKVRAVVKFTGRQLNSKSFGYALLKRILADTTFTVNVDMEPKFVGRHLSMVISPRGKYAKSKNEEIGNQKI